MYIVLLFKFLLDVLLYGFGNRKSKTSTHLHCSWFKDWIVVTTKVCQCKFPVPSFSLAWNHKLAVSTEKWLPLQQKDDSLCSQYFKITQLVFGRTMVLFFFYLCSGKKSVHVSHIPVFERWHNILDDQICTMYIRL